jgi:membrane protein DedA with SNARE-associated domain
MDLEPHLDFLARHPYAVVFWSSLVEAAGVPFPSRIILILTPAFLTTERDVVSLIVVAAAGAVLGDHVPYLAGRLAGTRMLGLYCRITLASEQCVERALWYFARFGPAALLFSRFSASVRLFASACAACSELTYARYLLFDAAGTVVYATLWILVGVFIGERAVVFLTTDRRRWLFLGLVVVAAVSTLAYRLWRRYRAGPANPASLDAARAATD